MTDPRPAACEVIPARSHRARAICYGRGGGDMKKRTGKAAPSVEPVDPRFARVVAAFAADAELAAVADEYAASQLAGGRKKFGSRALKVGGKIFAMMAQGNFVVKLPAA